MIKILDEHVINRIAAGEVIERPFSIIKELVENSIDANATKISIEILNGCLNYMKVSDNGNGFDKNDIEIAFLRHATSKIESDEDLQTIDTLGFRGEALASICSVSKLTLITKNYSENSGYKYELDYGVPKEKPMPFMCNDGTTFVIENLFDNVPVRKNFLKNDSTEVSKICDIVEKMALSNPNIAFKLIVDKKEKLITNGNGKIDEIIYELYGRDIHKNILEINKENSQAKIKITGFIGSPTIQKNNRNDEIFFVNGRFVHSDIISSAIEDAYKNFLMQHKFPFSVLFIDVDKRIVDVNVHPKKEEVRFSNDKIIYESVYSAVYETISSGVHVRSIDEVSFKNPFEKIPQTNNDKNLKQFPFTKKEMENRIDEELSKRENSWEKIDKSDILFESKDKYISDTGLVFFKSNDNYDSTNSKYNELKSEVDFNNRIEENTLSDNKTKYELEEQNFIEYQKKKNELTSGYRIIGQLFSTYVLCETKNSLYIIDQHAAHEKVNYEKFIKQIKSQKIETQNLINVILITLSNSQMDTFKKYQSYFNQLGFQAEEFGDREIKISVVPVILHGIDTREVFLEILDGLVSMPSFKDPNIILDKIASMSCKASVKGNNKLTTKEIEYLIEELLTLENPYNCPHGRPTVIAMTKYELEKKFKRII